KKLVPSTDPGRFDLLVNGIPEAQDVPNSATASTAQLTVTPGQITVGERVNALQQPPISLDQYDISITCLNGATPVATTGSNPAFTLTLAANDNVVCTITNTRKAEPPPPSAHLTVTKNLVPSDD